MTNFTNYKPIRLIELFAGIGAQAKALTNLGVKYDHWVVCEWDKNAIASYNAVHGTNFAPSDITKLTADDLNITDTCHYTYLLTYSFPCQDLSTAGKGAGMEKGSGTRSGLLWEVERLLNECEELPQVLLMENVPQVHGKNNIEHFNKWIEFLKSKGYSNYWADLNAKDYGIPQSRNRCYMVSILGDYSYDFPQSIPLELRLGDLLEQEVEEKFYLSDNRYNPGLTDTTKLRATVLQREVCNKAVDITKPYEIIDYTYSNARLSEINEGKELFVRNKNDSSISCTLTTNLANFAIRLPNDRFRIFTPIESWRLMGFNDSDFNRAANVCESKYLYQQAGNSIVVNVLMAIFKPLFVPPKSRAEWLADLLNN